MEMLNQLPMDHHGLLLANMDKDNVKEIWFNYVLLTKVLITILKDYLLSFALSKIPAIGILRNFLII